MKLLHSLRQKPNHHKKAIAVSISAVFTLAIALVWATSFPYFYGTTENSELAQGVEKKNSPIEVLKNGTASVYQAITGKTAEFLEERTTSSEPTLEYVPE